ncbi:general odorant-binding protein 56d-like [Culicoides brevitarsis]|uniref:general odorant-binding protein 56d-like n=1 Tax=Culicoides brevitarsis TaxID=469753 RepID=UPI00307C90AB
MKAIIFALLFVFILGIANCYDIARVTPIYEGCKSQFPSIEKFPTIPEMMATTFETSNPQIKCFIHCIIETAGEVDATGNLVVAGLKSMGWGDETKISAAANECIGIKGIDKCDTSYQQYGCFMMKMM